MNNKLIHNQGLKPKIFIPISISVSAVGIYFIWFHFLFWILVLIFSILFSVSILVLIVTTSIQNLYPISVSSRVHNSASYKYNFVKRIIWLQTYPPILIILLHRKTRRDALYDINIVEFRYTYLLLYFVKYRPDVLISLV